MFLGIDYAPLLSQGVHNIHDLDGPVHGHGFGFQLSFPDTADSFLEFVFVAADLLGYFVVFQQIVIGIIDGHRLGLLIFSTTR